MLAQSKIRPEGGAVFYISKRQYSTTQKSRHADRFTCAGGGLPAATITP